MSSADSTESAPPQDRHGQPDTAATDRRAPWYAPFCRTSEPHPTLPHDAKIARNCGCPCHGSNFAWWTPLDGKQYPYPAWGGPRV